MNVMNDSMFSVVEIALIGGGVAFLTSLSLGTLFTSWMQRLSCRWGAVDQPDGFLKRHRQATATLGGIPLFLAMSIGILIVILSLGSMPILETLGLNIFWGALFVACLIILSLGISDDLRKVRPRTKFLFQMISAMVLIGSGLIVKRFDFFGVFQISLGALAVPFTLFWIVGSCNAFNFIDGMDGLAAGIGVIASLFLAIIGFSTGSYGAAIAALALAGALSAILLFNFKPAMIFLGDSGSQLVGLMLGILSLKVANTNGVFLLATAGTILSVPIFDALLAILRRYSWGESPAYGDHKHIHHCLREHGLNVNQTTLTLWLAAVIAGAMGVFFRYSQGIGAGIGALMFVGLEFYLGLRLGCLNGGNPLQRFTGNLHWKSDLNTTGRSKARLDDLWEQMKPLFEQLKLDRAVLTLEGINENGKTDFETYMWVRSKKLMADILASRWTKRFSLDDDQQRIATIRLESAEQLLRDEQRIEWLLKQIRSNMQHLHKSQTDKIEPMAQYAETH